MQLADEPTTTSMRRLTEREELKLVSFARRDGRVGERVLEQPREHNP